MAGARLTATFDDAHFQRGLAGLRTLMRDTTPMTRVIGVGLVASTESRLGGTTAPDGSQWHALSPAYAALKTQPGMLKERGTQGGLLSSITSLAGHNHVVVGASVFRLGPGRGIVRAHSVTIPARPYPGISREDEAMIVRVVDGFWTRALADGR